MKTTRRPLRLFILLFTGFFFLLAAVSLIAESLDAAINLHFLAKNLGWYLLSSLLFAILMSFIIRGMRGKQ